MDNREGVVLESEPPPPYCEWNEGYDLNENAPSSSTCEDTASYQNTPQDQLQSADNPRQQENLVQEEPPDYQQSQLKYFQQREILSLQHDHQEVVNPVIQDYPCSGSYCHCCPDRHHPEHVARVHPNHPLQLRFPFAVVSDQPPVLPIQNPNTLDTEELIDREDPVDKYIFAWVACLLCCWPIGIPAIITSKKARDANRRGEYQLSYRYSKLSGQLSWCAIVIGFFFYLAVIVVTLRVLRII